MQTLFLLLLLFASGRSNSINSISYGFPLNTLLECYVANPLARYAGQPKAILETPPTIRLMPGRSGTVWLPQNSQYSPLVVENLNATALINFLGSDYLQQLTRINTPSPNTPAPSASQYIGVADGSGEAIILLSSALTSGYPLDWTTTLNSFAQGFPTPAEDALNLINAAQIGNCPLMTNWTLLPSSYFPPYFSGGYCADSPLLKSCSIPAGLHCQPDLSPENLVYMTVLRWDCCWNFYLGQSRWDCGWRKVQIPVVARCTCSCN